MCCMPLAAIVTWKSFRDGVQKVLNTVYLAASKNERYGKDGIGLTKVWNKY